MKRIFSKSDKERSRRSSTSVNKPKKPGAGLQYFTYGDVVPSEQPRIGTYPQHGDTVALGSAEAEEEIAKSRASKRQSQAVEAGHTDIFANAPEEPLAPEGPSRRSREASRRSSQRVSRRGSMDGTNGASRSRGSRAISPERSIANGRSRRDSSGDQRLSRRMSDGLAAPAIQAAPQATPIAQPEPVAPSAQPTPLAAPALAAVAASTTTPPAKIATPPTAAPSPAVNGTLSQAPTMTDGTLSRQQTRATSGAASKAPSTRQSARPSELGTRRPSEDTTKSKSSRRQSKRSSKPPQLKYFTYDDVIEGEPPIFGESPQQTNRSTKRNSRSIKGKERETLEGRNAGQAEVDEEPAAPKTPVEPPQLQELPQKLSQMDMSGTGLSRRSTKDTPRNLRVVNDTSPRPQQEQQQQQQQAARTGAPPRYLTASHGLDFSDIPNTQRSGAQAPPPVNLANKPPSKQPSREFRGAPTQAAVAAAVAASGAQPRHHDATAAKPVPGQRTSSFHEHLDNDDELPQHEAPTLAQEATRETFVPGVAPAAPASNLAPAPVELKGSVPAVHELEPQGSTQPVVERTREALHDQQSRTPQGARTPRARRVAPPPPSAPQAAAAVHAPEMGAPAPAQNPDGAFVSAPSSPSGEKPAPTFDAPGVTKSAQEKPSTAEVVDRSKFNSADTTVTETLAPAVTHETVHKHIKHVREERITREVHTYDIYHRVQPIIDVQVLSTRHFLATQDGGLVEVAEKDVPRPAGSQPNWTITPVQPSSADRKALLDGRYAEPATATGAREETKHWIHPDGYPVTETTHIYPPVLNEGGVATGQTTAFHFDHAAGVAGFVPPGVPQARVIRTRGNSITKSSVDGAADDLGKVTLQEAKSVPFTSQSGATQTLRPATGDRQPSTEHLSSQNI